MDIKDVPQDEAFMIKGKIRDVCYAVDRNGHYTSTLSMGWGPKNDAIRLVWEQIYEQAEAVRDQIIAGELSPLAFYMKLHDMDASILSGYAGIPARKVKNHMRMKNFRKLSADVILKYALALNLTPAELVDINRIREIKLNHED
jgi:hypothetical protein